MRLFYIPYRNPLLESQGERVSMVQVLEAVSLDPFIKGHPWLHFAIWEIIWALTPEALSANRTFKETIERAVSIQQAIELLMNAREYLPQQIPWETVPHYAEANMRAARGEAVREEEREVAVKLRRMVRGRR